ncbi:MAG: phosphatidylserine decarboxylase, partial [Lachnospiraceae bacterium]|nr:phosphatidylserine decarboxylase [Lachnospiraceae bacterium]
MLKFLYETIIGRMILKGLTAPGLSRAVGHFLDTKPSKIFIKSFVRNNGINLDDYYSEGFTCFNDCFCRRVKEDRRPVDMNPSSLIAPCDGLLSAYRITDGLVIPVKQSRYGILDLLCDAKLAEEFKDGLCLVFRLCVDNYHRYHYFDNGSKGRNIFIPGKLHTVRPIALRNLPVFTENAREYTVMETENFGKAVQIEVGAMFVGKIANNHEEHTFKRGEEKGCFLYGGSTVILLLKKDAVGLDDIYFENTGKEIETPVKMGQKIG